MSVIYLTLARVPLGVSKFRLTVTHKLRTLGQLVLESLYGTKQNFYLITIFTDVTPYGEAPAECTCQK